MRYVCADLPPETAAILARELGRGANVLFNTHQRAIDHEVAATKGTGKGIGASMQRLGALVMVLREPTAPSLPVKTRDRSRKPAVKRSKLKSRKSR
jgi:hypothetical protein